MRGAGRRVVVAVYGPRAGGLAGVSWRRAFSRRLYSPLGWGLNTASGSGPLCRCSCRCSAVCRGLPRRRLRLRRCSALRWALRRLSRGPFHRLLVPRSLLARGRPSQALQLVDGVGRSDRLPDLRRLPRRISHKSLLQKPLHYFGPYHAPFTDMHRRRSKGSTESHNATAPAL